MPMQKRYWLICVGLIGAIIALTFTLMWLRRPIPVKPFNAEESHQAWATLIQQEIATLPLDASPERLRQAREKVSALTVRSEDKDVHLSLVLALMRWEQQDAQAPAQVLDIAQRIK